MCVCSNGIRPQVISFGATSITVQLRFQSTLRSDKLLHYLEKSMATHQQRSETIMAKLNQETVDLKLQVSNQTTTQPNPHENLRQKHDAILKKSNTHCIMFNWKTWPFSNNKMRISKTAGFKSRNYAANT